MSKLPKKRELIPKIVMALFQLVFLIAAIISAFQGNFETTFICSVGLILTFLPQFIERGLSIDLPIAYELTIAVFVFTTVFMGEVGQAYEKFWWWDVVLHASSGVLLGFVGFLLLFVLYRQKKLIASAAIIAFFTLVTGLASAGLWEILEFGADEIFGTNMQKGAVDTMSDIIVASFGSLLAAIFAYIHIEWPKRSLFKFVVKDFFDSNPLYRKKNTKGSAKL